MKEGENMDQDHSKPSTSHLLDDLEDFLRILGRFVVMNQFYLGRVTCKKKSAIDSVSG